jgi:hypothetical protein
VIDVPLIQVASEELILSRWRKSDQL